MSREEQAAQTKYANRDYCAASMTPRASGEKYYYSAATQKERSAARSYGYDREGMYTVRRILRPARRIRCRMIFWTA